MRFGLNYGFAGSGNNTDSLPTNGLIHHFDETSPTASSNTVYYDSVGLTIACEPSGNTPDNLSVIQVNGLNAVKSLGDCNLVDPVATAPIDRSDTIIVVGQVDSVEAGISGRLFDGHDGSSDRRMLFYDDSDGRVYCRDSGTSGDSGVPYTLGDLLVFQSDHNTDDTWQFYINGILVDSGTGGTSWKPVRFFSDSNGSRNSAGVICEVLIYDRMLTAGERASANIYLQDKWFEKITHNGEVVTHNGIPLTVKGY